MAAAQDIEGSSRSVTFSGLDRTRGNFTHKFYSPEPGSKARMK